MYANYHTHTKLCNHASGEMKQYVETAIKNGIKILGFSDHNPCVFKSDYYSTHRMLPEEIRIYINNVLALREEYENDIQILLGYEMEYYPKHFDDTLKFLLDFECDYLILGQHFLDNEYDSFPVSKETKDENILKKYVNQVIAAMNTGVFSYVAHPDIVGFAGDNIIYQREMTKICQKAKELKIPLEINLLGIRENRRYPIDDFWEIAAQVGNEVVLGSDAHSPEWAGNPQNEEIALKYAHKFGIKPIEVVDLVKPKLKKYNDV